LNLEKMLLDKRNQRKEPEKLSVKTADMRKKSNKEIRNLERRQGFWGKQFKRMKKKARVLLVKGRVLFRSREGKR